MTAKRDPELHKRFAGIEIPPELKWSNFFNLYLATLVMACLVIVPAALQPYLGGVDTLTPVAGTR